MAASLRGGAVVGLCLMAMAVVSSIGAAAQLSTELTPDFYDRKCPQIHDIVKEEIRKAVAADPRNAASLIRLHFHDCFVNGCDGSILLNGPNTEQLAPPNKGTIRGLDVIDAIKAKLEAACPKTVSCADIVAVAYRDSAVAVGLTPGYNVLFGRRDSLKPASIDTVNQFLPGPASFFSNLLNHFQKVGLDVADLVALSGAHTVGRSHCNILLSKSIKDNTDVGFDPVFHANQLKICNGNPNTLVNLDPVTPDTFDNVYYKNLLAGKTNFISDQALIITPGDNQKLVRAFAASPLAFATQFGISSIKMGNINPLTKKDGEIRLNCNVANRPSVSLLLASE